MSCSVAAASATRSAASSATTVPRVSATPRRSHAPLSIDERSVKKASSTAIPCSAVGIARSRTAATFPGGAQPQHAVGLRGRVAHQLAVDGAVDVVVVDGGRIGRPGPAGDGDRGRIRQLAGELADVLNLLGTELQREAQRDRVGHGTVGAAFGDDLHRDQRAGFEAVEVDLVDHRHVDRDPVADQHGVVLRGDHADDVPAPLDRLGDLPRRHFEVGHPVDGNYCRTVDHVAGQAGQRHMPADTRTRPGGRARVRLSQAPHRRSRRRRRRQRGGRRVHRPQRGQQQLVGRNARVDLHLVQQRRRTLQRFQRPLPPAGRRLAVGDRLDGSRSDAGQHDLGGVVADVYPGDHDLTDRHRNRPRLAYTTAAWRTSSAHRDAPRVSSDTRRASNCSAVDRCGRSAS